MITATAQTSTTVVLPVAYTCQSCLYGYTLYTNQCLACNYAGCTTCTVATGSSVTMCSACATTYYLGSSNSCVACSTWNIACNACTSQGCTSCGGANYFNSGYCIGCLPGCSVCSSPTVNINLIIVMHNMCRWLFPGISDNRSCSRIQFAMLAKWIAQLVVLQELHAQPVIQAMCSTMEDAFHWQMLIASILQELDAHSALTDSINLWARSVPNA